jgi:Uma2 family endonuclease
VATTTGLMTVEEYWQLPKSEEFYYELHHGELIRVSRPKWKHVLIQWRIRDLLKAALGLLGCVETEVPFRPLPEHELWAADVAFISRTRFASIDENDTLHGAPEIVIEVLSPSNTASGINEKAAVCLENGSVEFWVVDQRRREIKVSTPDGLTRTYKSGESIPLTLAGSQSLSVDLIFADTI